MQLDIKSKADFCSMLARDSRSKPSSIFVERVSVYEILWLKDGKKLSADPDPDPSQNNTTLRSIAANANTCTQVTLVTSQGAEFI
jgi:PIN domain nuclease of toxin-antitoxin system